ncbi:hypothetical protein ACWENS_05645 [Streptomyces sp. NPDC004532]
MGTLDTRIELSVGGTWTNVTSDVYLRDGLSITRGRTSEGSSVDPASCQLTLNNKDGKYSPRNPLSPYYGLIGRNTPLRVSVPGPESYLVMDGSSSDNASTPDAGSLDITGDLDMRWEGEADWTAPGAQILFGKWGAAGNRSYHMRLENGSLFLHTTQDGTTGSVASVKLPALPRRAAVRGSLIADNGANAREYRFYWAPSIDGPWQQIGATQPFQGVNVIFVSTANLALAPQQADGLDAVPRFPVVGRCYRAELRGANAATVAAPDFRGVAPGVRSFTDRVGKTWFLSGAAEISNRRYRFVGEVASWPSRWHVSGQDVWVPLEAAGILRRLGQGAAPLQSTMRREFSSPARTSIVAYWPCEDGGDATSFASATSGAPAMTRFRKVPAGTPDVQAAQSDTWAASAPLPTMGNGTLRGYIPAYPSTGQIALRMYARLPEDGVPAAQRLVSIKATGSINTWQLWVNPAGLYRLVALGADSVTMMDTGYETYGDGSLGAANLSLGVELTQNGANIDWRVVAINVDGSTITAAAGLARTGTLNGQTVGAATQVRIGEDGNLGDTAIGHVAVANANSAYGKTLAALVAQAGETAVARLRRLCDENNLRIYVTGDGDSSALLGPQNIDTLLTLLQEAADADGGLLYEDRESVALAYRTRTSQYNQTPTLTLTYGAPGHVAPPFEPTDDDQLIRNDRTVSRKNGSSATAVLEEGPLSVQAPPAGVGRYDDQQTVNVFSDDQLPDIAYWELHLGTVDDQRYPSVTVNLAKAGDIRDAATAVAEHDVIRLDNLPQWLPSSFALELVEGYRETIGSVTWAVTFNASPAEPWYVSILSDPTYGRLDTDGSALVGALTSTGTTATVLTPGGVQWIDSNDRMTGNPDFELSLSGWTPNGSTIDRVPTPPDAPFSGDWSMQITPNGTATVAYAQTDLVPVTGGRPYYPHAFLLCTASRQVNLNVNWYDATRGYLSTSAVTANVVAGEWREVTGTLTAPATAAFAQLVPTLINTPPASHMLIVDIAYILDEQNSLAGNFPFDVMMAGEAATVTAITDGVRDEFSRTVSGGWGTPDVGSPWVCSGTPSDFSVANGAGAEMLPATGQTHYALTTSPGPDVDVYVDVATSALATGSTLYGGPVVRASTDLNNWYMARIGFTASGTLVFSIQKRLAGTETSITGLYTSPLAQVAGKLYRVRMQAFGSLIRAKLYDPALPEPDVWHLSVTDSTITAANNVGCRSFSNAGNTNVNPQIRFDLFRVVNPQRFTVNRSNNGVIKPQTAGTPVNVAQPAVIAL